MPDPSPHTRAIEAAVEAVLQARIFEPDVKASHLVEVAITAYREALLSDPGDVLVVLTTEDAAVLRESLWHSVQRADVPDDDRRRMHDLRARLGGEADG